MADSGLTPQHPYGSPLALRLPGGEQEVDAARDEERRAKQRRPWKSSSDDSVRDPSRAQPPQRVTYADD